MPEPLLPKRFRVLERISNDDAGLLLRARDELLKREVTIHCPGGDATGLEDPKELERSLRQARALARVQHAGVVRLLDVLETEAGPVLVMEPVAGETLREVLAREKRLAPDKVRQLGIRLSEALEAVHAAGVVHRGVSAANIVVRADATPCLTGFVFAKFGPGGSTLPGTTFDYLARRTEGAQSALLSTTPPHPAPEQILGQPADARSDVFGLGWVLYECLTGEPPYPFDHDPERWKPPADPSRTVPGVPKPLSDVVLRCLSPSPLKRIRSARELRDALEAGGTTSVPGHRRRIAVASSIAALLVVAFLVLRPKLLPDSERVEAAGEEARGIATKGISPPRAGRGSVPYADTYDVSRALLIGIGEAYARNGFPALQNAERDVAALADRLRSFTGSSERWSVQVLTGPTASHDNILARLSSITDEAGENDKVFVYYAGHGAKHGVSEKSGWIIPADGVTQESDPSHRTWVRFDEFAHLFDESKAKHVLVAMDCCYGGRLVEWRSATSTAYSRKFVTEPAKIIISSGRPNEQVSDGVRGENSPFARAFLDTLSRTDVEAITTTDIFADVQRRLLEEDVGHVPVRGTPPGASQAGEVVFFLK